MLVSISLLAAAALIQASPIDLLRRTVNPHDTTIPIALLYHANGNFWSTTVNIENSNGRDAALDTGGGQFIVPSSTAPHARMVTVSEALVSNSIPSSFNTLSSLTDTR